MYNKKINEKIDKTLGYSYFMDRGHPLASSTGRVYTHRHVASVKLGRWLSPSENVHHLDGNKTNNVPENLVVLSSKEHANEHHHPVKVKRCLVCGIGFKAYGKGRKHCSIRCSNIGTRKVARPSISQLEKDLLNLKSFVAVGKKYGVSDNAIRKWMRPIRSKDRTLLL